MRLSQSFRSPGLPDRSLTFYSLSLFLPILLAKSTNLSADLHGFLYVLAVYWAYFSLYLPLWVPF